MLGCLVLDLLVLIWPIHFASYLSVTRDKVRCYGRVLRFNQEVKENLFHPASHSAKGDNHDSSTYTDSAKTF